MDLESNFVCEFKRDTSNSEFASSDVRNKLFGFRDFSIGVGLPQRTSNESIKDSIRLEVPESIHDSRLKNPSKRKFESSNKAAELSETVVQAAAKMYPPLRKIPVQRCFPQGCVAKKAEISARVSADVGTIMKVESNDKAIELPEKGVQIVEKIYPPRRTTLVNRHFPQSCVAKNHEINAGVSLVSAEFRTEQMGDLSNKKAQLSEKVVQTAVKIFPPRRTISATRYYPQGFASKVPQNNARKAPISPDRRNEQRDKASELPDVVAQTAKKMESPQRRISITRCFPQGCSKKDPQINPGMLAVSTDFRTEHKVKQSDSAAELPESVAQTMMKTHSPQQAISVTRCPDGCVARNSPISGGVLPLFFDVRTEQKVKVQLSDKAAELPSPICTNFKTVHNVELSYKNAKLPERVAKTAEKTYSPQSCVPENFQTNAGVTLTPSDFRTTQKDKVSDQANELWERDFQQELEICAIWRGTSCSRYSPQGYEANNPQINTKVAPTSPDLRAELQEHYFRNALVENDAERTTDNQHQRNMKSTCKITKTQSNYDCFEAKREKWSKNGMEKGTHGLPSSRKKQAFQPQEEASIDSENPSHRVIVMALMAPTYYQSMQTKRVKKKQIAGQNGLVK